MWPFKKKEQPVWNYVGYLDINWERKNMETLDVREMYARAIMLVSNDGDRKFITDSDEMKRLVSGGIIPAVQLAAWQQGGPLPDDFTPAKVSGVKPSKLPALIRHDFNELHHKEN